MVRSPDGRIYWTAQTANGLHVMRYDPRSRKGESVGVLRIQPIPGDKPDDKGQIAGWGESGRKAPTAVGGIQGSAFDSKGNLYLQVCWSWPGYCAVIVPREILK
jgi:hypothetical protein